jgi:hypothetical protein
MDGFARAAASGWPEELSDDCPNCGNASGFALAVAQQVWPRRVHVRSSAAWKAIEERGGRTVAQVDLEDVDAERIVHATYRCLYCRKTVLLQAHVAGGAPHRELSNTVVIVPRRPPRDLPVEAPALVRACFGEASDCEGIGAFRGAGALYRAAVEALCGDLSAAGTDLYKKIESLRGRIDDGLVDDLHEARILGNWSIHSGVEFDAEEVADVAGLIEDVVEDLYVAPARKVAMRARRKARRDRSEPESGA